VGAVLYLVRHAKAGTRRDWFGDDRLRPLTKSGVAQAEAIADRLELLPPSRLISSPYRRCVQTLEPLAARIGLPIETDLVWSEGAEFESALQKLTRLEDRTVMSSHGDVIPELISALERRGMAIKGEPSWRKGAVWVLNREVDGREDGFSSAEAWPPPL
jgi:8-oxo-dGTP diphosphatase